ncbi:hypothetical protein ACEQ8H_003397 [Pleosporales sp. CAS-2024a]
MDRDGATRQRFSKSRNGILDVRWKQAPNLRTQNPPRKNKGNPATSVRRIDTANRKSTLIRPAIFSKSSDKASSQHDPTEERSGGMVELILASPEISQTMSLSTPRSLSFIFPDCSQDGQTILSSHEQVSPSSSTSPLAVVEDGQVHATNYASELWNMETFWDEYLRPLEQIPLVNDIATETLPSGGQDEAERIGYLFHEQTRRILSIDEEVTDQNPWKTLIWPLARECPALYHAIAALTFFGMSRRQPQSRMDGARHMQQSMQLLTENGDIPCEANLAARLVLGFAETWKDETRCTTDSDHIHAAGLLLHQIHSADRHDMVFSDDKAAARLDFMGHTWLYMDALARFTSDELSKTFPDDAILDLDKLPITQQYHARLDPLMGYSTTFFPTMRRVADLINKVRAREAARNAPTIIAQAIELRREIEKWTLPIDLEAMDEPSQVMTDAIQTAEAYRWSTLMILYQAIPELPNLTSYGELAQKILVYLATIPLSSTTIIIHIFPLMIAGCDAVEEEDRQFVRERWKAMSQRMVTGMIDRCLQITEEVWKRREEYLRCRGLAFTAEGRQINTTWSESTTLSKDIASFINPDANPRTATQSSERLVRKANDFPISAAFKRGVDILTRSGCTEYTVRGRLNWLGVMKDWGWQGKIL